MIEKPKIKRLTVGVLFFTIKTMRSSFKLFFFLSIVIILPSLFILLSAFEEGRNIRSRATKREMEQPQKIIFLEFEFDEDEVGDKILEFDKPKVRNGYIYNEITGTRILFTATVLDANYLPLNSRRFSLPDLVAIDGLDVASGREHGEMREVKSDEYAISLPFSQEARFVKIENVRGEIINLLALEGLQEINNLVAPHGKYGDEYKKEEREREREEDRKEKKGEKEESGKREERRQERQERRHLLDTIFTKIYAANGTFNIAILGDNYSGDNIRFQSDVNDLARGLTSIEPFASNKDKIVFYSQLASTQICQPRPGEWPSINCNDSLALQEASSIPYDKAYVLYNGNYTGYAYIGGVLSYGTNSLDQNLAVKQGLFIHEMAGHSLGGLMDEYSYGASGLSYAPNCSNFADCPSWSTIPDLGCFTTCGYTNLYRATENNSVMNTSYFRGLIGFDSFSTQIVGGKLVEYLTLPSPTLTLSPVTEVPTPTLTSIPSLTPSPSITPTEGPSPTLPPRVTVTLTPTPIATPIPTFTLTPTPSPSPTITPTITAFPQPTVLVCSVPNYCTAAKYCGEELQTVGSCGVTDRVCCQPQTRFEEEETDTLTTQSNLPLPTPTAVQQFVPLPTVPLPTLQPPSPTVEIFVAPSPTATIIPSLTPTPTSLTSYLVPQNLQPTNIVPTRVVPTQMQATNIPILPTEEISLSPTPAPTSTLEVVFERATPTPTPQPSAGNILQTSISFIAVLFKTVISILFGQ